MTSLGAHMDPKGKVSQGSVNYRTGSLKEHCGNCTMFKAPSSCTAVSGTIRAGDVCDLYKGKQ